MSHHAKLKYAALRDRLAKIEERNPYFYTASNPDMFHELKAALMAQLTAVQENIRNAERAGATWETMRDLGWSCYDVSEEQGDAFDRFSYIPFFGTLEELRKAYPKHPALSKKV